MATEDAVEHTDSISEPWAGSPFGLAESEPCFTRAVGVDDGRLGRWN